jgi:hypothetical protein
MLRNKSRGTSKKVLAKWVSTALEKAPTEKNIKSGFCSMGIFPFNPCAMEDKMGPSEFYNFVPGTTRDYFEDPIALGLAAPMTVDLVGPGSPHHMPGSIILEYSDSEGEGGLHQGRVACIRGG